MACSYSISILILGFLVLVNAEPSSYHVRLNIFSGVPDPEWIVGRSTRGYTFLLHNLPTVGTPLASRLGYSGFTIDVYQGSQKLSNVTVGRCTQRLFEGELLNVMKPLTPEGRDSPLQPGIIAIAAQDIAGC